jgi:Sulfotransferase domain
VTTVSIPAFDSRRPVVSGSATRTADPASRWFGAFALVLLFGYAIGDKGFAYVKPPGPIFLSEVLLILGLVAAGRRLSSLATVVRAQPAFTGLLVFVGLGALFTVPYLGRYQIDAIRDAALWYYGLFAFIVATVVHAQPDLLRRALGLYARFLPILLAWLPIGAVLARREDMLLLPEGVSLFASKSGNAAVHAVLGLGFVLLLGPHYYTKSRRQLLACLAFVALLASASQARGGMLGAGLALLGVFVFLGRARARTLVSLVVLGSLVFGTLIVTGVSIETERGREVSADQLLANASSIVSGGEQPRNDRRVAAVPLAERDRPGPAGTGRAHRCRLRPADGVRLPPVEHHSRSSATDAPQLAPQRVGAHGVSRLRYLGGHVGDLVCERGWLRAAAPPHRQHVGEVVGAVHAGRGWNAGQRLRRPDPRGSAGGDLALDALRSRPGDDRLSPSHRRLGPRRGSPQVNQRAGHVPNFVGIGVPRGGSTWLHELLDTHPDVWLPTEKRKELHYFDILWDRKPPGWYTEQFAAGARLGRAAIGEITPTYFAEPDAPQRIRSTLPELDRLLLILREPAARMWSEFNWQRRHDNFAGTVGEFLAERPDFAARSHYGESLAAFLTVFARDQLLVLVAEEAFADPATARVAVAEFLGIDPARFPDGAGEERVNEGGIPRFRRLYSLASRLRRRAQWADLDKLTHFAHRIGLKKLLLSGKQEAERPSESDMAMLKARYADDVTAIEAHLGREVPAWR